MHRIFHMAALLLLAATASTLQGATALRPSTAPAHSAGCHGDQPATPSPAPSRYQCCVNGHHTALPNAPFAFRSMAAQPGRLDGSDLSHRDAVCRFHLAFLVFPSNSPPHISPLRI